MLEIANGEVEGSGEEFVVGGRHDEGLCGMVGCQIIDNLIVVARTASGERTCESGKSWGRGSQRKDLPQRALATIATAGAIGIVLAGRIVAVLVIGIRIGVVVVGADELHRLRLDILDTAGQRRGSEAAQFLADGDAVAVVTIRVAIAVARVASTAIATWSIT